MKHIPVRPCDSVLFDLDGTLWDASHACALAWTESLRDVGRSETVTQKDVRRFTGLQIDTILTDFFPSVQPELYPVLLQRYQIRESEILESQGGELYAGTEDVLWELSRTHRLFIVSNCLAGYVETFFRHTGLESLFDDWESLGRTGKPKAANIATIIERHQLQFPVYIGDTAHDAEAAETSKVPFVFAQYGFGSVEDPRHSITALAELLNLL